MDYDYYKTNLQALASFGIPSPGDMRFGCFKSVRANMTKTILAVGRELGLHLIIDHKPLDDNTYVLIVRIDRLRRVRR